MDKDLVEKIEDLGWSVSEQGDNEYLLSKFSPAGQDFNIVIKGESTETLIEHIHEVYDNYDVSEETYLWLDNTGHGKNGAPYHMKDLLEDMEACEQMILDLYNQLSK